MSTQIITHSREFKHGFWYGLSAGLAISGLAIMLYVIATGTQFCAG